MKKYFRYSGFTLIELMVVVAIIGILSAIAYPAYLNSMRKSNRTEAKTELMDAAQRLQRCYSAYGKFNDTTNCAVYNQITATTPLMYSRGNAYYQIAFKSGATLSATEYTLEATAVKAPQTKDTANSCNKLTLDQDGTKGPTVCW